MDDSHYNAMLSPDRELVFALANKLTGTMEADSTRHEIVISNVIKRMEATSNVSLLTYLNFVSTNESELAHFISAVTIHTTGWFRELSHYRRFEQSMSLAPSKLSNKKIRVLSSACSTGEELYSFGMILESIRRQYPSFDYELVGFDIDPISVQRADNGFYQIQDIGIIPQPYRRFLINPKAGETKYIIDPDIRRRSYFHVGNLLDQETFVDSPFDFVFCRNALIYFSEEKVTQIITNLLGVTAKEGSLTLGHSEAIDPRKFNLLSLGESSYRRSDDSMFINQTERSITVLSIDDSSWVRLWLATTLAEHGIRVLTSDTTEGAKEILARNRCDLITLDLNLKGKNGLPWLRQIRSQGISIPVLLLTESQADQGTEILDALSSGSQDYVNKNQLGQNPSDFIDRIRGLVTAYRSRQAENAKPSSITDFKFKSLIQGASADVILIGASTGGTGAISQLLTNLPATSPPIICVQHIPREFAGAFLERLAASSGLKTATPEKGKVIKNGHIYLSTSDAHIGIRQTTEGLSVYYSHGEKISGHRPSIDYLFQTASFIRGKRVLACLLTGMGRDGAQGLLELKRSGALTAAQDERSSVVWGMPGEAIKLGAPLLVGNIQELREFILQCIRRPSKPLAG